MVGWQLSRIGVETMWLASGICEAFYYVGWHAEQVRGSINVVSKRDVQLCVLAHRLWHEVMTLAGDTDEAFSYVGWQPNPI